VRGRHTRRASLVRHVAVPMLYGWITFSPSAEAQEALPPAPETSPAAQVTPAQETPAPVTPAQATQAQDAPAQVPAAAAPAPLPSPEAQPLLLAPAVAPLPAQGSGTTASDAVPFASEPQEPRDPRGTYFQLRALGLFGVNTGHEFATRCPESDCSVRLPLGFAVGFATGWEKKGWALEFLGLFLFDETATSYRHPVTRTVLVPAPQGEASGSAMGNAGGSGGGGFDIDIGTDGIDIDIGGDLGLPDVNGSGSGSASGDVTLVEQRVFENKHEDIAVRRIGAAVGLGVRRNFGRRPARLTLAASGGVLFRRVSSPDLADSAASNYRAPFVLLDAGFVLGKRGGFHLGVFGMAEFPPTVSLTGVPGIGDVRVIAGPQYFVGPLLAVQWGPRSTPKRQPEQLPALTRD
jgi:hypothetical protein